MIVAEAIMAVSQTNHPSRRELTTLWLRGNHFSSSFCKIIGGGGSSAYSLTDVDLSGNPLGDVGLQHVATLFHKCPELRSLCLSRCRLHLLSPLHPILISTTALAHLDVSWNLMSTTSSASFVAHVSKNTSLTSLNCAWNHFGGGKAQICGTLARALELNSTLQTLDLSNNGIGEQDAFILSEAVFVNKGLKYLVLNGNPLGLIGGQNMFSAMDRKGFDSFSVLFHGCNIEMHDNNLFDPSSPEGHHCLDLSQPYQRAVAMSLYRKCCESGPDIENWKGESLNGRKFNVCVTDPNFSPLWLVKYSNQVPEDYSWVVPEKGVLVVNYSSHVVNM